MKRKEWRTVRFDAILIDGMNVCIREAFSKANLRHRGTGAEVIHGFFRLLLRYLKENPGCTMVVAWDSKSFRREHESSVGVTLGVVPEAYKENRRKKEHDPETKERLESAFEQVEDIREILDKSLVHQARVEGFEGDDVINTYARDMSSQDKHVLIVSSDKDYYQCLSPFVSIETPSGKRYLYEDFVDEFGFEPPLWVDRGALEGEAGGTGDNIFGVPGIGKVLSTRYVVKYGGVESIISSVSKKKKHSASDLAILGHIPRIRLARSLKQMDHMKNVPDVSGAREGDEQWLKNRFASLGFIDLMNDSRVLVKGVLI